MPGLLFVRYNRQAVIVLPQGRPLVCTYGHWTVKDITRKISLRKQQGMAKIRKGADDG